MATCVSPTDMLRLPRLLRRKHSSYELLSTGTEPRTSPLRPCRFSRHQFLRRFLRFRSLCIGVITIATLLICAILASGVPSLYGDVRRFEHILPQHNISFAQHSNVKYISFPDHIWGHGWNNVLQQYLMFSYLACITNRSFVFEDYTWSHLPSPYTLYDFALRPTRIPLNAYISGPTAGGPMDNSPESPPRAVSFDFWQTVCPPSDRHIIDAVDSPRDLSGPDLLQWWKEKIESYDHLTCLEVDTSQNEIFDFGFFGGQQILDVWPTLSRSPILTRFKWSPLVLSAIQRNFALFPTLSEAGNSILPQHQSLHSPQKASSTASRPSARSIYPELLAVHIRRGDFKRHCSNLAEWGPGFHGFNSFKGLPDPWTSYSGSSMEEKKDHYRKRCLPDQEEIVERLHNVRKDHDEFLSNQTNGSIPGSKLPSSGHKLKRVFVLTNAWPAWQDGLKRKLMDDGWEDAVVSEDLTLDKEQKGVNVAVDMSIAERAEVFVGNGFSSLSGMIIMLRLSNGLPLQVNRYL